ncbi:MAG TPA: SDR family oxidoreductase [Thermoanaerobaculia bacterium]|nr:SDR family oxidoreductase [Thermoanaerobaculia bacterium]
MTSETRTDGRRPVAIVTGGSRGIGRAIVEGLLDDGWRVFLCSRDPASVAAALDDLAGRGEVAGRAVDVREQAEVDGFVDWVAGEAGRLDCLVNNAGLGHFAAVDELSGDQWREVLRTNLDGPFYFLRAAAPAMKRSGGGWVFNVASLAAQHPLAGGAAYNASKFGLLGMSEAAMLDLRHHGVRVTTILPGSVDTGFRERKERDWMLQPQDVAQVVRDLLRFPPRALPSKVEIRPTAPPRK